MMTISGPFSFWESPCLVVPELKELAMIILAMPMTPVSVERSFRVLNDIFNHKRTRMTAELLKSQRNWKFSKFEKEKNLVKFSKFTDEESST